MTQQIAWHPWVKNPLNHLGETMTDSRGAQFTLKRSFGGTFDVVMITDADGGTSGVKPRIVFTSNDNSNVCYYLNAGNIGQDIAAEGREANTFGTDTWSPK